MALCFAVLASAAFAQTNNVSLKAEKNMVKATRHGNVENIDQAAYKGSIFAKSGEIYTNTFATEPTTGTLADGAVVNGTNVAAGHAQTAYHSMWHRIADTNASSISTSNYPVTGTDNYGSVMEGETPMDGFMLMTMQDQISAWGGTGTSGAFNAYMAFPAFSTTGKLGFDVTFYQYYRKFNNDQCWIDYSTDNTTWNAVEINVKNIDVAVNSGLRGWTMKCMPTSLGNQANVYLRIRWECSSNNGGAYGYIWMIDDLKVGELPATRLTVSSNQYYEGFYHLMPQGLNLPVVWTSTFSNTGTQSQSNVTGHVYAFSGNQAATEVASVSVGTLAMGQTATATINPLGFYAGDDIPGYNATSPNATSGTKGYIPTTALGNVRTYADITTNLQSHVQRDSIRATFDTMTVIVNNGERNIRTWGRDNGILSKWSYSTPGMIAESTWSSDPDETMWSSEDYSVCNSYATGDVVPEGWRIKGVEIVGSTRPGFCEDGVKLATMLWRDSVTDDGLSFLRVTTGAGQHVVNANTELNLAGVNNTDPNQSLEYETFGNYNTVRIIFPDQPRLEANTSYRIGYTIAEDGFFCAAENRTYYYDAADSTGVYFRDTPGMTDFAHTFGHNDHWGTLVYDPYDQKYHIFSMSAYPMIRMLVGPYEQYAKYAIHFQCGDNGNIYDAEYNELCGTTDSCVEGSSHTYIFTPDDDYTVETITINGEVVFDINDVDNREDYENSEVYYGVENMSEETTISCTFVYHEQQVAVEMASTVSMNLQPNPATSNVQLTISGVEGMVNFSLIDMSGRVITSSKINAANVQNINVSNLAKGAYFVRITNNNMSKVEKLIVR